MLSLLDYFSFEVADFLGIWKTDLSITIAWYWLNFVLELLQFSPALRLDIYLIDWQLNMAFLEIICVGRVVWWVYSVDSYLVPFGYK